MFELISGGSLRSPQRAAWPMLVSTVAHMAFVLAIIVMPLLYVTDRLPEVPVMMAFVAAPPPPPPPPAPPPAPRATVAEVRRPTAAADAFTAPIEAPSRIEPEAGIERGVEGGVPGGVEGGVPGGVIGGIVGGLPADVPPPPPPPPPVRAPVRIGGHIHAPALIRRVAPEYPVIAVEARVQGTVILEATVNEKGLVEAVRILRSIHLLDEAALEAVHQWQYSPLLLNGTPRPFILTVTVSFRIGDSPTL